MRIVSTTLLSLLLCGCVVSTKPPGDTGFARKVNLQAFEGCFADTGEAKEDVSSKRLSRIIWPDMSMSAEVVQVDLERSDTLRVSAISAGDVVQDDLFLEGKDFTFTGSRIKLKFRVLVDTGLQQGSVGIGVASEARTLGLDQAGNIRAVESVNIAGTYYLIPVVAHISETTRFDRLATCHGSQ